MNIDRYMGDKTKRILIKDVKKSLRFGTSPSLVRDVLRKEYGWTMPKLIPVFEDLLRQLGFTVEKRPRGKGNGSMRGSIIKPPKEG